MRDQLLERERERDCIEANIEHGWLKKKTYVSHVQALGKVKQTSRYLPNLKPRPAEHAVISIQLQILQKVERLALACQCSVSVFTDSTHWWSSHNDNNNNIIQAVQSGFH